MSPTRKPVGEMDQHAYLDGELDDATRTEVEAWLADHPDDGAKVEDWRRQKDALHRVFDGVLTEPLPAALEAILTRRGPWGLGPGWMRAAAAVALFVLGGATGWGLHGWQAGSEASDRQFVRQAVGAHVVYVSEVRHPVEVKADEESHLVAWLSKRLGQPVRAPKLGEAGFQLVGGRLLPDGGKPAAQFMYEDGGGRRVMLYIRSGRRGGDTAFRFVSEKGVAAFYWIDGPMGYVLTGKMPRGDLLRLARLVYDQLED